MASETPAQAIGELHRKGTLAPGKDADVVVLDEKLSVLVTIARGRIIYDGRN
jgi:N-acetylglucosamine-6-phosphate deacetylase